MDHLINYTQRAGDPAQPPTEWPMTSSIAHAPGKAPLIMVAHPRCPCTRASVEDLSQLMAQAARRVVFGLRLPANRSFTVRTAGSCSAGASQRLEDMQATTRAVTRS